jgi:glutamate-1-semialdehyde 2,1-aminomutase
VRDLVITLPYNDLETLDDTVRAKWGDIAAIIVEPVMGNCAGIEPQPGWLELIRSLCDEFGIVMIMDEVKTGFRLAPGGAQEIYGVLPDLACYAKAMGNGFPVAAFGGKREVMEIIVPGEVAHGGTYCGNVVGTAAAVKTLELLADGTILSTIRERGERLKAGLSQILTDAGIPHAVCGPGSMFGILLTHQTQPREFRDWARADKALYEQIVMALVERGVMPDPDAREPWFLCYAHDDPVIDQTLNVFEDVIHAVKEEAV